MVNQNSRPIRSELGGCFLSATIQRVVLAGKTIIMSHYHFFIMNAIANGNRLIIMMNERGLLNGYGSFIKLQFV